MISVVVPTYNESKNIKKLVSKVDEALKGIEYEIIYVDDSTDNTPEVIREVSKEYKSVKLIHREGKRGLATALHEGFKMAKGEYIASMDGDLQHPPYVLKKLYDALENGADMAIPSRKIDGGKRSGLNWYRKLISRWAKKVGHMILPCLKNISDPTSGMFMIKREVIEGVKLEPSGWQFMVEVLAMGNYKKITEIPYEFEKRQEGKSKISVWVGFDYLKLLLGLRKRYNKNNHCVVERGSL